MRVRAGERGFTLIEVLISILLCVVAVIGIMGLYRVQTRSSSFSRHTTEATALAEDRVEQLRTQQTLAIAGTEAAINERGTTVPAGIYTRTWTITNAGAAFMIGNIQVSVTWNEDGSTQTVTAWGQW